MGPAPSHGLCKYYLLDDNDTFVASYLVGYQSLILSTKTVTTPHVVNQSMTCQSKPGQTSQSPILLEYTLYNPPRNSNNNLRPLLHTVRFKTQRNAHRLCRVSRTHNGFSAVCFYELICIFPGFLRGAKAIPPREPRASPKPRNVPI